MYRRGYKNKEGLFLRVFVLAVIILGLLFAGSYFANSQEREFSDPFHLGNIQELGMDLDSQIELLKEDREYYLSCQRAFKEKGDEGAYLWVTEIIKRIEADLKKLKS